MGGHRPAVFVSVLCFALLSLGAIAQEATPAATPLPAAPAAAAPAPAPLRIVGTYPLPGETFNGRLLIFFDEDLAPLKNADGTTMQPLTVDPPSAQEQAANRNYLSLQMSGVSGVYTFTLSPELRSVSGRQLPEDKRVLRFSTVPIRIERVLGEEKPAGVSLQLFFNASMNLDLLKSHTSVTDAKGQPVTFAIAQGALSVQYVLTLPQGTEVPVNVSVRAGATDSSGQLPVTSDQLFRYPDLQPLGVASCRWTGEATSNVISFQFNAAVSPEILKQHLRITDAATGNEVTWHMESEAAGTQQNVVIEDPGNSVAKLRVELAKGLRDTGTRVLESDYAIEVMRPGAGAEGVQPLRVTYSHWETYYGSEGLTLFLEFTGKVDASAVEAHLQMEPAVDNLKVLPAYYQSVKLTGDWRSRQQYTLTLSPGLSDIRNRMAITEPCVLNLQSTPYIQYVKFAYPGKIYFPRRGTGQMTIEACNVKETELRLHWLFPSNLPLAVNFGRLEFGDTHNGFNEQYARFINKKKVTFEGAQDVKTAATINVAELMPPDRKGVFTLQGATDQYGRDTKVIVWTDIGVVAHWLNDEVAVFAHNLYTLAPLPAAKVTLWSAKNQVMATATTDAQGITYFRGLDTGLGKPHVVVIETENDSTFLKLAGDERDPVAYDETMPNYDYDGYDAFLYADRNLYRPGETVHARWLVRTHYGDAAPGIPLVATLMNPKGVEAFRSTVTLSALGTGLQDIETKPSWLTGRYELRLSVPGSGAPLGTCAFNVEDFVPHRIKAEVKPDPGLWLPNVQHGIHVSALNLFGTPAANLKCEATVLLSRGEFKSEKWKEFRFGNDSEFAAEVRSLGEQQTDAQGQANFNFTYQPLPKATFPLRTIVRGEVAEAGGRGVAAATETLVLPCDTLLGVGVSAKEGAEHVIQVHAAAIKSDETPAPLTTVQVTLEREEWDYNVRHYEDYNEPKWSKRFQVVETRDVTLENGRADAEFTLSDYWSYYRVRVSAKDVPVYSTLSFYARWNGIEVTPAPRPTLLKLVLGKEQYQPGEEAELRIESPFDGRGIVTLQADRIQTVLPLEVKDGAGVVKFPVTAKQYPNVWAEVTLAHQVKPGSSGVHPFSSFAMISVPVTDPARKVEVAYPGLPEEMRPNQEVQFTIETKNTSGNPVSAEVTLAAVDEGIHDILGYTAPDPFRWFQRARRPDYRRADYYDRVAYDFLASSIGGDAIAKRLGKSTPGIGENWIKPVALWSGAVTTDAQGKAVVTMTVPEFNGQLRLVAVAATQNATGANSAKLYVRRPYILRTSMPRFALPGDKFSCLAVLFNTTQTPAKAKVKWTSTGALIGGEGGMELDLPAASEARCSGQFAAGGVIGQGAIAWDADIVGPDGAVLEHLHEDAPLPVRPSATYETHRDLFVVQPGESRTFTNVDFVEDAQLDTAIVVGANPLLRLKKALEFLVHYPYGCVEQTISSCFPTYLVRKSEALAGGDLKDAKKLEGYLKAGVERLFSMQTGSGALSYWPGSSDAYNYGSVYACHFLTLLHRDHEIPVPEPQYKTLRQYVRRLAEGTAAAGSQWSYSDSYVRAYACYVLSLEPDLKAVELIQRFDTITVSRPARYLLAAALAMNTQDPQRVAAYLKAAPYQAWEDREMSGSLNSSVRSTAVELMAMLQFDDKAQELSQKADALIQYLEGQRYTTQEAAFATSALGLYLSKLSSNAAMCSAVIHGSGGDKAIEGTGLFEHTFNGPGPSYTVQNTGTVPMFVNITMGGVPVRSETAAVSEGVSVQRSFQDARGAALAGPAFAQGDEVVVDITLECRNEVENLILADLLPAGFEVENPRLDANVLAAAGKPDMAAEQPAQRQDGGESSEARDRGQDKKGPMTPAYLEIRDDRLVAAFDKVPTGTHHYYYVVRAVTPGAFQYPSVYAECMYDPAIRGASAPGQIEVK